MTKMWIAAFAAAYVWAQPVIAPPQLGFVEDSARALRPAYGLAGNFVLGPSMAGGVISEAFSGSLGLLKTDSSLAAFDSQGKLLGSMNVAGGPALFAFSPSDAAALAYIPSNSALVEWRWSAFAPVSFDPEVPAYAVLAIAFPSPFEASLLVRRRGAVWELRLPLGASGTLSQKALMGVRAPVLALPSGDLVYSDQRGIVIRRTDASEVSIAALLPAHFSLQQMNAEWVQLTDLASSARLAIHTMPGRESLYRLPE